MQDQLEESTRICDAATDGPWGWYTPNPGGRPTLKTVRTRNPNTSRRSDDVADNLYVEDADFVIHARTALPQCNAALKAVLELHHKKTSIDGRSFCAVCRENTPMGIYDNMRVVDYPCPTVRAIEEAAP